MAMKRGTKSPEEGPANSHKPAHQTKAQRAASDAKRVARAEAEAKTFIERLNQARAKLDAERTAMALAQPTKIHGGLLAAYEGVLEGEIRYGYAGYCNAEIAAGVETLQSIKQWGRDYATRAILADSPRKHLEVYLQWNGILGFSGTIWGLAHGRYLV